MEQYIVSARKYRPATFDMVVGQRALTTTLLNSIRSGKLAHAYLFCGPRGVGKTTCARIFAKTINCQHLTEQGDPCGQCESCKAFEEGRSLNIHELDAASNNSVDDIRELIDQVRIPPQIGKYKVFIIDEVHMLSQAAFNAFLKTLEEPPHYVIFILATTEKHKILPTILSRCQVYDFSRITVQNTVEHLKYVAEKEGYTVEEDALNLIAQKADGGMRDALSIFDQMVSFTQGNVTYQATLDNLNILDAEYYFRLVDYMLSKDIDSALLLFNEVLGKGFDGGNFIAGLAGHLRDLLVSRDAKTLPLLEVSESQQKRYHEQAMRCKPQFLYRAIKLCNECDLGYRQSRNKRLQVEICLLQTAQSVDEDGDASGLRPRKKILKPIFSKPAAQGVAGAETVSKKTIPATVQPAPKPAVKPTQKISLEAVSIRRITNPSFTSTQTLQPVVSEDRKERPTDGTLTTEGLIRTWQEYASQLETSDVVTTQRMRGIIPEMTSPSSIRVTVTNPLVEKSLMKIKPNIEAFIAEQLHLPSLSMNIEVAKSEVTMRVYNKGEQFREMLHDSTALAKLHELLSLELG